MPTSYSVSSSTIRMPAGKFDSRSINLKPGTLLQCIKSCDHYELGKVYTLYVSNKHLRLKHATESPKDFVDYWFLNLETGEVASEIAFFKVLNIPGFESEEAKALLTIGYRK